MIRSLSQLGGEKKELERRLSLINREIEDKEAVLATHPEVDAVVGKYYLDLAEGTVTHVTGVNRDHAEPIPSVCRYVVSQDCEITRAMTTVHAENIYSFQTVNVSVANLMKGMEITEAGWESVTERIRLITNGWVQVTVEGLEEDREVQRGLCRSALVGEALNHHKVLP